MTQQQQQQHPESHRRGWLCNKGPPKMTDDQKLILQEMERISRIMDMTCLTICNKELGLDGFIGLIPGIGDLITAGISFWIVIRMWFAFDPWIFRCKWFPSLFNVSIDLCLGIIPFFGDIFDFYWKVRTKKIGYKA